MHDPPDYGISGKMIRLSIPPHVRPDGAGRIVPKVPYVCRIELFTTPSYYHP